MKIATFNINGITSRLDQLLEWLAESKPDVACLQELKSPDPKLPLDAIRTAGYGVITHGQPSWNGVAILARKPRVFTHLLHQGAGTDAVRACHPDRVPYTFWTYWRNRFARDAGLRIDHLLLNADAAPMLCGAGVDRDVRGRPDASDHAPAWIKLANPKV